MGAPKKEHVKLIINSVTQQISGARLPLIVEDDGQDSVIKDAGKVELFKSDSATTSVQITGPNHSSSVLRTSVLPGATITVQKVKP